ncbi:hypothetical protein VTI74DRAFT_9070 [Chaetomium olivicolor]
MRHSITHSLLLLLPVVAPVTLAQKAEEETKERNFFEKATDKVKDLFGDPVAMANNLHLCQQFAAVGMLGKLDCYGGPQGKQIDVDCVCKDGGQKWEELAKTEYAKFDKLLAAKEKEKGKGGAEFAEELECTEKYGEGKLTDICRAIAEKPEKKNETMDALSGAVSAFVRKKMKEDGVEKGAANSIAAAAGFGGVSKVALAAVAGYAVTML